MILLGAEHRPVGMSGAPHSVSEGKRPRSRQEDAAESTQLAGCIGAILDLLQIWGFQRGLRGLCFQKTYHHWKSLLPFFKQSWMRLAKYKLAAFFSAQTDQELPPIPPGLLDMDSPCVLVSGSGYRFLRTLMLKSDRTTRLGILESLKLSKKGMPRPSEKDCAQKVVETVRLLTTPVVEDPRKWWGLRPLSAATEAPLRWGDLEDYEESDGVWYADRNELCYELRRTVREVCEGVSYSLADRGRPLFPSINAAFQRSRAQGGAAGHIIASWAKASSERVTWDSAVHLDRQRPEAQIEIDDLCLRFWSYCLRQALDEQPRVRPVGLAEALKVRVISKGPAFTYFVLKPLQRKLRELLCRFPEFRSLRRGGDLTPDDFQEVIGGSLPDGWRFLSGDFEAATDNLRSWVSETIWAEIVSCLHLSKAEEMLGYHALTRHVFRIDKLAGVEGVQDLLGVDIPQSTGQLMGSIISFPVLCIANYTISRMVIERDSFVRSRRHMRYCMGKLPCFINGDDVVFKCSLDGRKAWRNYAGAAGLKESVGKTYHSPLFLEMNSRLMEYVAEEREELRFVDSNTGAVRFRHFRYVPFVNLGLVNGMKRSEGKYGVEDILGSEREMSLGARHRELLEEVGAAWAEPTHRLFLIRNQQLLEQVHVPWYVSERFGGLGLHYVGKCGLSDLDIRLCRAIALGKLEVARYSAEAGLGWKSAQQVLRENFGSLRCQVDWKTSEDLSAITTKLALRQFLTSDPVDRTATEVVCPVRDVLRRNERLWARLVRGRYGIPGLGWRVAGKFLGGDEVFSLDTDVVRRDVRAIWDIMQTYLPEMARSGSDLRTTIGRFAPDPFAARVLSHFLLHEDREDLWKVVGAHAYAPLLGYPLLPSYY
jgi:hypothetical protein